MTTKFLAAAILALTCTISMLTPLELGRAATPEPAIAFAFSSDPAIAAQQHGAYDIVHRYEELLNAGDTAGILALYAQDSVAEWNDKPTFATMQEKKGAYDALFRIAKFTTVFGYAGIDVHGDTAVVSPLNSAWRRTGFDCCP